MKALEHILTQLNTELDQEMQLPDDMKPDTNAIHQILNTQDAMVTLHSAPKQDSYLYVNDRQRDFYGFDQNELGHLNLSFYLKTFHPSTYPTLVHSYQFFHRNDLGFFKLNYRLRNAQGHYEKVNGVSKTVAWNTNGKPSYILSVTCEENKMLLLNASTLYDLSSLTKRPMETLNGILQGLTNGQIAQEMGISQRTVEKHVETILKTTGVSNRGELIRHCATFR